MVSMVFRSINIEPAKVPIICMPEPISNGYRESVIGTSLLEIGKSIKVYPQ